MLFLFLIIIRVVVVLDILRLQELEYQFYCSILCLLNGVFSIDLNVLECFH